MAGKEVYIGRMIEGLQASIDKQVQEMEQVSGILADMSANYGVTVQQKAFTGAGLSAVPIVTYKWQGPGFSPNNPPSPYIISEDAAEIKREDITIAPAAYVDLEGVVSIDATFEYGAISYIPNNKTIAILIDDVVVWEGEHTTDSTIKTAHVNIRRGNYYGVHKVSFKFSGSTFSAPDAWYKCGNIRFSNGGIESFLPWKDSDLLIYDSDKLTLSKAAPRVGYGYGFINFPEKITGEIATWVSLIFQANTLDGVNLSIVDASGNEIKGDLLEKNAIGDLTVYDFYIKFEFRNPKAEITGVILRYT